MNKIKQKDQIGKLGKEIPKKKIKKMTKRIQTEISNQNCESGLDLLQRRKTKNLSKMRKA